METTNDGFTFRRVSTNKIERDDLKYVSVEPRVVSAQHNAFELGGFTFKKVSRGDADERSRKMCVAIGQEVGKSAGERGMKISIPIKKDGSRAAENKENANESNFVSETAKKRKTIRLEDSLDLSTGSAECPPEGGAGEGRAAAREDACGGNNAGGAKARQKVKSFEIYKKVSTGNINDLIRECVHFLQTDTPYASEILRHCDANYFSDIDFKVEIDSAVSKIEGVRGEIAKWNGVYKEQKADCGVEVERLAGLAVGDRVRFDEAEMAEEFREKAQRLKSLENRLRYFFENAKVRSEALLRNIFGAVEDRSVDALFLLKAMSKLGR